MKEALKLASGFRIIVKMGLLEEKGV